MQALDFLATEASGQREAASEGGGFLIDYEDDDGDFK